MTDEQIKQSDNLRREIKKAKEDIEALKGVIETDTDTIHFLISPNISSYGGVSRKASFKGKAFTNLVAAQIISQRERELYEYEFQLKSL